MKTLAMAIVILACIPLAALAMFWMATAILVALTEGGSK